MSAKQQHPFHLVELSPWPILTAFSLLFVTLGVVFLMHGHSMAEYFSIFGGGAVIFCSYHWWKDVIKEGRVGHHHTEKVRMGLRIGMALFILSEAMFFFGFFFSFFLARFFPAGILEGLWVTGEGLWPPKGIQTFDPWDIPFMNTLILLLSGTTVTWAHYAITQNDQRNSVMALGITVLLGIAFTTFQAYEYHHAAFKLTDGIYAANFYLATGFHGLHVIIGTIFLTVCYFRAKKGHFIGGNGHLGFEFAAWYWHFVDVVWLFLFVFVYVLGR
ncbi:MAG: cytochrome c oxidase subunit 3 [Rickettsiales bacterium]|jgi:cytochrome c oxidase subunit 3|nr:cytochrome c oxidase subunit 3 [Rickettsiales bacterium]